jgi:Icc-related predicted phosphoesterase
MEETTAITRNKRRLEQKASNSEAIRIAAVSDVHGEFLDEPQMSRIAEEILDGKPDIIILAGDIHTGTQGAEWVKEKLHPAYTGAALVMISGNHEYYSRKIDTLDAKIKKMFHLAGGYPVNAQFFDPWNLPAMPEFLQNESIEIGGILISGTTLWTDGTGGRETESAIQEERIKMGGTMNDYKKIRIAREGYRKIKPTDTIALHYRAKAFLKEAAAKRKPGMPWIVVTHHAPSTKAFANFKEAEHESFPFGACASNLDEQIAEWNPDIWIHGHIHQNQPYEIGNTRIFNVARGYPDETNYPVTHIQIPNPNA